VTVDGDREATKSIAPGQPVTDANSKLMGSGLRKTVTMPIYGEDGTLRSFTFEVPIDTSIPPNAYIVVKREYPIDIDRELALERALVADIQERLNREVRTTEGLLRERKSADLAIQSCRERINRLETDVNMIELERDALKTDLAELRTEFAKEVQRGQNLQQRMMQSNECALETINDLVAMIAAAGIKVAK
jgi:Mg2+ and Co2+ transporter CorA